MLYDKSIALWYSRVGTLGLCVWHSVERRSLAGELSLSCARPVAGGRGWPLMRVMPGIPSAIGQPTRPTQHFIPSDRWVVSCNWMPSISVTGGAIWWTLTKEMRAWCMAYLQVKLCDPCWALGDIHSLYWRYINRFTCVQCSRPQVDGRRHHPSTGCHFAHPCWRFEFTTDGFDVLEHYPSTWPVFTGSVERRT